MCWQLTNNLRIHRGANARVPHISHKTFASRNDGNTLLWQMANLSAWLWDETHLLKAVGSNPITIYWMDIFSH